MKKQITLLLMLGTSLVASSQNFADYVDVSASLGRVHKTIQHDIDGDGDIDVVFGSGGNGKVGWYENLGAGSFSAQRIIADGLDVPALASSSNKPYFDMKILDVNADNNPDLVCSYRYNLVWFENLGGGSFSSMNFIDSNNISFSADLANPSDVDGDGVLDITIATGEKILWYKNLGGTFSSSYLIADSLTYLNQVKSADLDGDGKVDLYNVHNLQYNNLFKIYWLKNLGGGSFAPATFVGGVRSPGEINAEDVDNDGDLDIIGSALTDDDTTVFWLQNNGAGVFSNKKLIYADDFSASGVNIAYHHVADVNSDGDIDVVIEAYSGELYWCENLGNSTFAYRSIFGQLPASGGAGYNSIDFNIDFNQDGVKDYLFSAKTFTVVPYEGVSEIVWVEGISTLNYDSVKNIISNTIELPNSVFSADIDGDGLNDVLSASYGDGKVAWFKNLGNNKFSIENKVLVKGDSAIIVRAADIDGDGDQDVISGFSNDSVFLSVNNGNSTFASPVHISSILYSPEDINLVDIDGDNDVDILLASFYNDKVVWYENLGGNSFSTENVISSTMDGAKGVFGSDFDFDGKMDVAAISSIDDKIVWFKNLGAGSFSSENVISTLSNAPQSVHCADINSDGKIDVLVASIADNKIAWFENLGSGNFSTQNVLPTNLSGITSAISADIDNDGDVDVVASAKGSDKVVWYENQGSSFSLENVISTITDKVLSIYVVDIDNDGDNDVLSASYNVDLIGLHENTSCNNALLSYFYKYQDAITNEIYLVDSSQGSNLVYHWDFGDGSSSSLTNLTHTYATHGVYNVCLTITDTSTNCSDYYCDSLDVDSSGVLRGSFNINVITHGANTTDVIEIEKEYSSIVYPNPTNNEFVNIKTIDGDNKTINVFDVYGKLIHNQTMNNNLLKCKLPQEKGIFFIRVQYTNGSITTHRVVKN